MSDAWERVPALGNPVPQQVKTSLKGSLVKNGPIFVYPMFEPVERMLVVSATGVATNVAETSVPVTVPLPANTSAVLYLVSVTSNATAVGTVLDIHHQEGGLPAGSCEAQAIGFAAWNQVIAATNSGQCTYQITKNSSTSYAYSIYVVGFFCSY